MRNTQGGSSHQLMILNLHFESKQSSPISLSSAPVWTSDDWWEKMSKTPPTIEEEDEDVVTTSISTSARSATTAIEAEHTTATATLTTQDDLPPDDPSSGSTETADDCPVDPHDFMTSSYTEISFGSDNGSDNDLMTETDDQFGERDAETPNVMQLSSHIVSWASERTKADYDEEYGSGTAGGDERSTDASTERPPTRPSTSDDVNQIVSFVADDLEHQLKLSSPSRTISSLSKESSVTIGKSESSQPPSILVDVQLLNQIEAQAAELNDNVSQMMLHISTSTHTLSKLTVECMNSYENCLTKTCDSVDANIRSMYQLMAQMEELNRSMGSIERIKTEVKQVNHLLDLFEKKALT